MTFMDLEAADGHRLSAWRAAPPGEPRGGLVVVQEIFGVNSHIRSVADRFAEAGFLAIAPALFDRIERGVELGYDEPGFTKGRAIVGALQPPAILADLAAARDAAAAAGRVGAVGYCYGGSVVWVAAARLDGIACVVSYYGSRIAGLIDEQPRVPVLMHVGRKDASFPMEKVHEIGRRHRDVIIEEHDAGHGFSCDQRADFHPESHARALASTLAFLGEHVG